MGLEAIRRISILRVPVDILPEDGIEEAVKSMLADGKNHQIILLSLWDLMRARRSGEYGTMVAGAELVIPISKSIISGAKFLKKEGPVRYMPFDLIVKLLGALEKGGKSLYLFGSSPKSLQKTEANLKTTFPGLRIVGRFNGFYSRQVEPSIIQAIRKATPSLLMVGEGVPGKERWIPRSMKHFNSGIYIWCSDIFDIFAERKNRVSREVWQRGLEWIQYTVLKPWKAYRFLIFLYYKFLLLIYRIRGR